MISGRKDCTSSVAKCQPKGNRREGLYCQINHSRLTRTDIAEAMAINPSTLSSWGDPHENDRIPEERLTHLLQLTDDNPAYVSCIAGSQGFIVYDPKTAPANVTRMVTEFAELLQELDAAGVDGVTTADEADRIERQGNELIGAVRKNIDQKRKAAALGPRAMDRES